MDTITKYADHVTRRAIADAAGVGSTAVTNAITRGSFPPAWFIAMRDAGLEPPEHLFAWKGHVDPRDDAGSVLACTNNVDPAPTVVNPATIDGGS